MRFALVVALVAASSSAYADNKEQPQQRKPCVCAPPKSAKPTIVLEIRWHSGPSKRVTKVFSTGMWTRTTTEYNGETSTEGGKLSSDFLDELKAGLKAARWKVGKPKPKYECDDNGSPTEFYLAGRKRYSQAPCGGALEEPTQKVLDRLDKYVQYSPPIFPDEEI